MYVPRHFAAPDLAAVHELLGGRRAADLITWTPRGLAATTVPFVFDAAAGDHGTITAHLARTNDQWRAAGSDAEALLIVRGPDAYVTPSWYATKSEHGRAVPTWNYVTAHVHGRLTAHDDPAWIEAAVRRLTGKHESGRPRPWAVDDAPRSFIEGQLRAIVGVEITITRIEAKYKLSQNRGAPDIGGVIDGLAAGDGDDRAVAAAMARVNAFGGRDD